MNKDNIKNNKNQACKSTIFRERSHAQREMALSVAAGNRSPDAMYLFFEKIRDTLAFGFFNKILWFSIYGTRRINFSRAWLANELRSNKNYLTEVCHTLCDAGIIIKLNGARGTTCEYGINPIFLQPEYQEILYMFFKCLRVFSLGLLCSFPTRNHTMLPTFKKPVVTFLSGNLYLIERLYNYNKRTLSSEQHLAHQNCSKNEHDPPKSPTKEEKRVTFSQHERGTSNLSTKDVSGLGKRLHYPKTKTPQYSPGTSKVRSIEELLDSFEILEKKYNE